MQVFLIKLSSKKPTIWHPCPQYCSSQAMFLWHHSIHGVLSMASDKPFNYHTRLWLLLKHIGLGQTSSKPRNDCNEDSDVDNRLEKYILLTLWMMGSQFMVFLFPANVEWEWRHINTTWLPSSFQMVAFQSRILGFFGDNFFQDSRHVRAWNFDGWKNPKFTCYRVQKS